MLESALQWSEGKASLTRALRRRGNFLRHVLPSVFAERVAGQLTQLAGMPATLSRDSSIESSHQRMLENMDLLLADLKR